MNYLKPIGWITLVSFAAACGTKKMAETPKNNTKIQAPMAEKQPYVLTEHGDSRTDNYYWMRLSDEQKNAATPDAQTQKVLDYLNAENAYTKTCMAHTEAFQKNLFEEMKGRIKETDQSLPLKDNGYWYYTRFEAGKDYAFYCRKKDSMETGKEEVLIDGPQMAAGKDYWALGGYDVSDDNQIMVYSEDIVSRRIYTGRFKKLGSNEVMKDVLEGLAGSPVWAGDNKTVFYVKKDPVTLREFQIWRHTLGKDQSLDELVFEEKDEEFSCFVYKTKSKKYMVIGSNQTLSNEYRVLEAANPTGTFRVIQGRERELEYSIDHYGDKFYITTNLNAKNFRLMETSENATSKENWKEVIPHRDDVLLEGIEIFKNFLVVDERKNGLTQLRVIRWSDRSEHYISWNRWQSRFQYRSIAFWL
jgi:oligopeptidase B